MSSVKINLEEMRRLSGMGPSQYPGWSLAEAKAAPVVEARHRYVSDNWMDGPQPPDNYGDDNVGERTHIDILDWDEYVKVLRYSEADDAREDRPEEEKYKNLDAALADLKKDKEITDADIAKIQKEVAAGRVFSKGGGVILIFSTKTGKLTQIDEA